MIPKGMRRMAHSRSTAQRWHTKANLFRWGARAMATITPVLANKAMRLRVTMQNNPNRSLICDWELVTTPTLAGTVGSGWYSAVVRFVTEWFGTETIMGPVLSAIIHSQLPPFVCQMSSYVDILHWKDRKHLLLKILKAVQTFYGHLSVISCRYSMLFPLPLSNIVEYWCRALSNYLISYIAIQFLLTTVFKLET